MTSSHLPLITRVAYWSIGVACKLMRTRLPPFWAVARGIWFAGETLRLDPMAKQRSALAALA